jgi:MscS family membrane protein
MLAELLHQFSLLDKSSLVLSSLLIVPALSGLLYLFLAYLLRPIFRSFEQDIALVTLNVSIYPLTIVFAILGLKTSWQNLIGVKLFTPVENTLMAVLAITISYWSVQLFNQVFIYYIKEYTKETEAMWDDVLLPILSAILPIIIYIIGGFFVLGSIGIDLTGIWVALGGATFVLGFALQDILANFFSGIVLLIDTPFRFGDILLMEDGELGMLRRIGIRVTHIYVFSNHCDVYIPNSVLQGQKITNLSRPTTFYIQSLAVELPANCDVDESKKLIEEIVLAHPDTLGNIEQKLELMDSYYIVDREDFGSHLREQQEIGKLKIIAEQDIYSKLEEIDGSLRALAATIQFAEKAGLTAEEVENIQLEYKEALELMGFETPQESANNRHVYDLEESNSDGLVELVRDWYRIWIKDPNLIDEDQYFISDEWERKINLLKRKAQRLNQRICDPKSEETRLDDYVQDLIDWIQEKMKVPRKKSQEPEIRITEMTCLEGNYFAVKYEVIFFVDEIKLEDGKRGERVKSQIYQEIIRHFRETYLDMIPQIEEAA